MAVSVKGWSAILFSSVREGNLCQVKCEFDSTVTQHAPGYTGQSGKGLEICYFYCRHSYNTEVIIYDISTSLSLPSLPS